MVLRTVGQEDTWVAVPIGPGTVFFLVETYIGWRVPRMVLRTVGQDD